MPFGLAACHKEAHPHNGDTEQAYVDAGPITYQIQLSRELSPYATDDQDLLRGLPATEKGPTPQEEWFAIFLWAKNQSGRAATTSNNFEITDTQGNVYRPIALNAAVNPFAWVPQSLSPGGTEPGPDNLRGANPTQGGLVLFKINVSAYANRPLTFHILGPLDQDWATVSLDL